MAAFVLAIIISLKNVTISAKQGVDLEEFEN